MNIIAKAAKYYVADTKDKGKKSNKKLPTNLCGLGCLDVIDFN